MDILVHSILSSGRGALKNERVSDCPVTGVLVEGVGDPAGCFGLGDDASVVA